MGFLEKKKPFVQNLFPRIIGRRAEIAAVKYAIKQMASRSPQVKVKDFPNIFYFHGPIGVGKSTVLQTVYRDCLAGELGFSPLAIWVDCAQIAQSEAIAVESFLLTLADAMIATDESLRPQVMPLKDVWNSLEEESPVPEPTPHNQNTQMVAKGSPQSVAPKVNSVKAAYGSLNNIQIQKNKAGKQNVMDIAESLTKNMQVMQHQQQQKTATIDNRDFLLQQFAEIIDLLSMNYKIVFFLDNYQYFEAYDHWFRRQFLNSFQKELIFVMAGENDLSKTYLADFDNLAYCIALAPFTVFDTEMYLSLYGGIADPKVVVSTHRLSAGNPLVVSMINGAFQNMKATPAKMMTFVEWPEDDYGDQMNKYIAYIMMDEIVKGDQNLLALLAIIRHFDPHLFQNLAGILNPKRTLENLAKKYTFVQDSGAMSEWVKVTLRGYAKKEMPALYQEVNQGAYEFFSERVREDPENADLLVDAMYYYFHLSPDAAYTHLIHLVSHYLSVNIDICDRLCAEVLYCAIPQEMKNNIRALARSLGYYRKKDPKGSQYVLQVISTVEPAEKTDMEFLQF